MSIVLYSQAVSYPIGDLVTLMEPEFGGASDATQPMQPPRLRSGQSDPGARFGIDRFTSCIAQGMFAAFIINILLITGMTQVALDGVAPRDADLHSAVLSASMLVRPLA